MVDYRIEGEHIYFDRINFHGDAISLRGKGEMNFQSQIGLTFYATVGRGELDLPVIKQVFSGAAQQIMLIHVDGTLQNPQTRKEALPGRQPCFAGINRRAAKSKVVGNEYRSDQHSHQCGRNARCPSRRAQRWTVPRRRSARGGRHVYHNRKAEARRRRGRA